MNFGMGAMKRMRKIIATLPPLHPSEHSFHCFEFANLFPKTKQKKTSRIAAQEKWKNLFNYQLWIFKISSLQTQNTFPLISNFAARPIDQF